MLHCKQTFQTRMWTRAQPVCFHRVGQAGGHLGWHRNFHHFCNGGFKLLNWFRWIRTSADSRSELLKYLLTWRNHPRLWISLSSLLMVKLWFWNRIQNKYTWIIIKITFTNNYAIAILLNIKLNHKLKQWKMPVHLTRAVVLWQPTRWRYYCTRRDWGTHLVYCKRQDISLEITR